MLLVELLMFNIGLNDVVGKSVGLLVFYDKAEHVFAPSQSTKQNDVLVHVTVAPIVLI